METPDALAFLSRHQPLPDDDVLTQEVAEEFDLVRRHFIKVTDSRCVELFLHSFGKGTGFGVYQLVDEVFWNQDPSVVAEALPDAILSTSGSVRDWAIEFAVDYPSREAVDAVKAVWADCHVSNRFWGAKLLQKEYDLFADGEFLARAVATETDAEVRTELAKVGEM